MKRRPWIAAALLLALAACATRHTTAPTPPVAQPPAARSPEDAVRRWAWAFTHRDTAVYASVLANDFTFVFAAYDSAGNPYRDHAWGLEDELRCIGHLFVGGGSRPPASDIRLVIDQVLDSWPDPRPGHAFRWHRTVRTALELTVTTTSGDGTPSVTRVQGEALFYLTRGDSAALSPERVAAGWRDSTRWYVDRWEDQTGGVIAAAHADPARNWTLGDIKALYW